MMKARQSPIPAIVLAFVLLCVSASCSLPGAIHADSTPDVPVAHVQESDLQLRVFTTGELRATRSTLLIAPPVAGGNLQIIHLDRTGTAVKKGDVVMAFDPSEQEYNLEQNRSDLEQALQEITKANDDAAVQTAQDQDALLKAKFAVRQAELQVSKNDLISSIDAQKNLLSLDEAKRALAQLQQDIVSHSASNQAAIALAQEKANKAKLAMAQAQQNIENMRVRSPLDGLVVLRENENASGGLFFGGMTLPDYQEGDQVNPGDAVAEVVDISHMEISGQVNESERANVQVGQPVEIHVDALPGPVFHGKVKSVAGMAGGDFFDFGSNTSFAITVELTQTDPRLRPGFTAHLVIFGQHLAHALTIPREALFQKDAKSFVYAKSGGFVQRDVKIRYLTEGLAVIEGLPKGTEIAEVNPQQNPAGTSGAAKSAAPSGPGPGPGAP